MHCPTLAELPAPPPGRAGWPWTEECPPLPETMPDGVPWPRISIVTPSYNQGAYIEETLRSILLQGYPDLEYIVIDGGSTDGAVAVIERYAPWLRHWRSEPDDGQADAINKGLALCTGEIFQFINSDDLLEPGALEHVALVMPGYDAVAGGVRIFDHNRCDIGFARDLTLVSLLRRKGRYEQQAVWFRLEALNRVGGFDGSLHYVFDFELCLRFVSEFSRVRYTSFIFAGFRQHFSSKTMSDNLGFKKELINVLTRIGAETRQAHMKGICHATIDRIGWYHEMDLIQASSASGFVKLFQIVKGIYRSPKTRLTRCSIGNIRQLVTNKSMSKYLRI